METSQHTGCRVIYRGRVQGVGFRVTAVRIAQKYPVQGYVRNCEDGSVELLVEGEREDVESFLQNIREYWGRAIQREQADWRPALGNHATFSMVV